MAKDRVVIFGEFTSDSKWKLENLPLFKKMAALMVGKRFQMTLEEYRPKRSNDQNNWWRGIFIPLLANHLGWDRDEEESLHYELVKLWAGTHTDEKSGIEFANKRSSKLTTEEFSGLMEWGVRFAAKKWDVVIDLPNEKLTHGIHTETP